MTFKRIVICADGTWQSKDSVRSISNVVRFYDSIPKAGNDGIWQTAIYLPGVGTNGHYLARLWNGATGWDLLYLLKDAYSRLCKVYVPGDHLYFVGFSRGAFLVRSLVALIGNAGILKKEFINSKIDDALKLYRSRRAVDHPKAEKSINFRVNYAHASEPILSFLGVWDTVGSLGNPLFLGRSLLSRNTFHDLKLSSKVQNALQLLALDERRKHFKPAIWLKDGQDKQQLMSQIWLPGSHSDIGGCDGYNPLSKISLFLMTYIAQTAGLKMSVTNLSNDELERFFYASPNETNHLVYKLFGLEPRLADFRDLTQFLHFWTTCKIERGCYLPKARIINRDGREITADLKHKLDRYKKYD